MNNETEGDQTLDEVKAKHEIVKTRKTELEVARLEGKLVDVNEIRRLWGGVANTVMQNLLRLPSKVSPRLVMMKDAEIIAGIIDKEIRDTLTQISETPLPTDIVSEDTDNEEESEEE